MTIRNNALEADVPTVSADQRVGSAAQLMADNGVTHLIVIDPGTGPSERDSLEPRRGGRLRRLIEMPATAKHPPTSATTDELCQEARRLQAENARLRAENRELRATLDAYIARMQSTALFGPCEMSAGTSAAPAAADHADE